MASILPLILLTLVTWIVIHPIQYSQSEEMNIIAEKIDELENYNDLLVPNMGVAYKAISALHPGTDRINFNIHVELPSISNLLTLLMDQRYVQIKDKCREFEQKFTLGFPTPKQLLNTVCSTFDAQIQAYTNSLTRTRIYAKERLRLIAEYVPAVKTELRKLEIMIRDPSARRFPNKSKRSLNNTDKPRYRPKRFLGLLFSAANTAMNAYRTISLQKRLSSMQRDITVIKDKMKHHQSFMIHLSTGLQALAMATNNAVFELQGQINYTNARVDNLIGYVKLNFQMIMDTLSTLTQTIKIVQLQFTLQTNMKLLFQNLNELRSIAIGELDRIVDGFHLLHKGRLPPGMVTTITLQEILSQMNEEIALQYPGYELLSTNAIDYYELDSIIWTIEGYNLLINVPVIIKETIQEPFQLYRVETFFVPYNVKKVNMPSENQKASHYTKIQLEYEYIAIGQHSYILLHENILQDCNMFAGFKVCGDVMIKAHKTSPCCLSIIYYQTDVEKLTRYCNVKYYHNLQPPSLVFEDQKFILLTNVDQRWRFICKDPFPVPQKGKSFALIEKKSLCGCEILIGQTFYIARKVEECAQKELKLAFHYPVNGIVVHALRSLILTMDEGFQYYTPQLEEQDIQIPEFEVKETINKSHVLYANNPNIGVDFQKVIELIRSEQDVFVSESDLIEQSLDQEGDFENWFTLDKFELAATFCMALIGVFAAIGICILAYKHCGLSQWATTFIASQAIPGVRPMLLPGSRAAAVGSDPDSGQDANVALSELRYRGYLILATIVSYIAYRTCRWIYRRYILYRIIMPGIAGYNNKHKSHFYLELASSTDLMLLYLVTVSASVINVAFHEKLQVTINKVDRFWFSTVLQLQWIHGEYRLFNDVTCSFPKAIPIPTMKRRQFLRMSQERCHLRLLIHEGVFYDYHAILGKFKVKPTKSKSTQTLAITILPEEESNSQLAIESNITPETATLLHINTD